MNWQLALCQLDAWDFGDEIDLGQRQVQGYQDEIKCMAEQFSIFIQSVMNTDVFGVMTLEAYVNSMAAWTLTGATYDMFDRLSLEAKWLFLPRLFEKPTFDPGAEPFQGLKRLVKRRNGLVHARGAQDHLLLKCGHEAHEFLEKHLDMAQGTITTVKALVGELSKASGRDAPSWVREGHLELYEIRIEKLR